MARKQQKRKQQSRRVSRRRGANQMIFQKRNYQLLVLGIALITIGYTAMRIENEVDGFISLYVAPIIILGGYLEIIYAILWRPRTTQNGEAPPAQG